MSTNQSNARNRTLLILLGILLACLLTLNARSFYQGAAFGALNKAPEATSDTPMTGSLLPEVVDPSALLIKKIFN